MAAVLECLRQDAVVARTVLSQQRDMPLELQVFASARTWRIIDAGVP
jgi:hypothetical protein